MTAGNSPGFAKAQQLSGRAALLRQIRLLCTLLLFLSPYSAAQSLDDCMQNNGKEAISVCQALLDSGNREPVVFYKLASELYQTNDSESALKLLQQGLELHPDDDYLNRFNQYVATGISERTKQEKSSEKDRLKRKLGQLKFTCRSSPGAAGIEACKEYLSLTGADDEVIAERLASLQAIDQQDKKDQQEAVLAVNTTTNIESNTHGNGNTIDSETAIPPEERPVPRPAPVITAEAQDNRVDTDGATGTQDENEGSEAEAQASNELPALLAQLKSHELKLEFLESALQRTRASIRKTGNRLR